MYLQCTIDFFFILCLHFLFPAAFRKVANPTRMLLASFYPLHTCFCFLPQVITWTAVLLASGKLLEHFFPLWPSFSLSITVYSVSYKVFTHCLHFFLFSAAGRNVANPTAMLLASAKMLEHLGLQDEAFKLKAAVNRVLEDQKVRTRDLGGFASTTQFTQAVVDNLSKASV